MNPVPVFPEDTRDAALVLIAAHDPGTRLECDTLAAKYRDELARMLAWSKANDPAPVPLPAEVLERKIREMLPMLLLARRYEGFRAIAFPSADAGPAATLAEEVKALAVAWAGERPALGAFSALKAIILARLIYARSEVEGALARYRSPAAGSNRPGSRPLSPGYPGWWGFVDDHLTQVGSLLSKRDDLAARIEALEPDEPDPVKAAARHVTRVVERAGGQEAIAGRLVEARKILGQFYSADPRAADLAEAEADLADVRTQLDRLGAAAEDPTPGSLAADLVARRDALTAVVEAIRADIEPRQTAAVAASVAQACAGGDAAREAIQATVSAFPTAFPRGFGADLQWYGPERESLDDLTSELVRSLPEWDRAGS